MVVPQDLGELTVEWLTAELRKGIPGASVHEISVVAEHEATNLHATIDVLHDAPGVPSRLFVKLPPRDPQRRARLDWASMGEREVRFYRDLAPGIGIRSPQAHVADRDPSDGTFVLVLEHLDGSGTRVPDPVEGISADLALSGVRSLARLHCRFGSAASRRTDAPWLAPAGRTSDYGTRLLREGIDAGEVALSDGFVAVAERYIVDRDRLQDAWELGPTTVLHGDAHIGNVFIAGEGAGEVLGFFDWGLMTVGSPLRDVSYFLSMCLSPEHRAAHERDLLAAYLAERVSLGGDAIDPDDAWLWHRLQSAYTVVASCQSIRANPADSPGRRQFSAEFVRRATAAVDDLDPLDALAQVADR